MASQSKTQGMDVWRESFSKFQQSLQQLLSNHFALLDQKLEEMLAEHRRLTSTVRQEVRNTISYSPPSSEITSGDFTPNVDETVQNPQLSEDIHVVTMVIGNEGGKEKGETGEKELPIEGKEDRSIAEGSDGLYVSYSLEDGDEKYKKYEEEAQKYDEEAQKSMIDSGDSHTTKEVSVDIPESGKLRSRSGLDPDPKPPDMDSPLPQVEFLGNFSIIPTSTIEGEAAIRTDLENFLLSTTKSTEVHVDHIRPSPQMAHKMAQSNPCLVYKYRPLLGPLPRQNLSSQPFDHHGSDLEENCNAENEDLRSRNAKKDGSMIRIAEGEDSRVWKTEIAQRKLDHLDSPELISASIDHGERDSTRCGYGRQSELFQLVTDLQPLLISPAIEPNQSIIRLDSHFEPLLFFPPQSRSTERRWNVGFQFVTTENEKEGNKTHFGYYHVTQTQPCYSQLAPARAQLIPHFQFHDILQFVDDGRDGWSNDQRQLPPPPPLPPPPLPQPPWLYMPPPPTIVDGEFGLKAPFDIRIYWNPFMLLPVEKEKSRTEVESLHLGHLPCFLDEVKMHLWLWRCPHGGDTIAATKRLVSRWKVSLRPTYLIKWEYKVDQVGIQSGFPSIIVVIISRKYGRTMNNSYTFFLARCCLWEVDLKESNERIMVIWGFPDDSRPLWKNGNLYGKPWWMVQDALRIHENVIWRSGVVGLNLKGAAGVVNTYKDLSWKGITKGERSTERRVTLQASSVNCTAEEGFENQTVIYLDFSERAEVITFCMNDTAKAVIELEKTMSTHGFEIVQTLIVNIEQNEHVKSAIDEITAATWLRMAATEKEQACKKFQIKRAEVEVESKCLSGFGLARQTTVDGLGDKVWEFSFNMLGTTTKAAMEVVLATRYFGTMKENGDTFKSSAVLVAKGPLVLMLTKTIGNETLAWSWTDGRMVRHSMDSSDRNWYFYEAEMELNWEDWTSMTTGWRDIVTGQQQFLYFYYPP